MKILLFICALFFACEVLASPGIRITGSEPDYATGQYRNHSIDMSVKVVGGYIRVSRTFSNKRWNFNRGAEGAVLSYARQQDAQPTEIEVSGISYKLDPNSINPDATGNDPQAVYFTEREGELGQQQSRIEKRDNSYRWSDTDGNWLNYDTEGQLVEGGNRNTVVTRTTRDAQNRIFQVLDVNNKLIMTYEYLNPESDKISRIEDYSGRTVTYHWQGDQLEAVTDVAGQRWQYSYSGNNELVSLEDPLGRQTRIAYVGGIVTRLTLANGNSHEYSYDYDETRKRYYYRIKDTSGRVIERYYTQQGLMVEEYVDDLLVNKVSESTSGLNRIQTSRLLNGTSVTKTFDRNNNLIKVQRSDGSGETAQYTGPYNKISEHINSRGKKTRFDYDANGNVTKVTEAVDTALQREVRFEYDEFGQRTATVYPADISTAAARFEAEYDDYGNTAKLTAPLSQVRQFEFDVLGRITQLTDPANQIWKNTFNAVGALTSTEDPLGRKYIASYNAAGECIQVVAPNGRINEFKFDKLGRTSEVIIKDSQGSVLSRSGASYNDVQRTIQYTDALGYSEQQAFNALGQIRSYSNKSGENTQYQYQSGILQSVSMLDMTRYFAYDLAGNINQETTRWRQNNDQANDQGGDNNQIIRQRQLNSSRQTTHYTDGNNNSSQRQYDILGRLIKTTDALGGVSSYGYNSRNQLLRFTDAEGRVTEFDYDALNRRVAEHRSPQTGVTNSRRYFYNTNNQLIQEVTPNGEVVVHQYDNAGQRIQTTFYSATSVSSATKQANGSYGDTALNAVTAERTVTYQYNALGQLTQLNEAGFVQNYQYDVRGLMTRIESQLGTGTAIKVQQYEYNQRGDKVAYTNPEGVRYQYSYTANGEIAQVKIPGQGNVNFSGYRGGKAASILFPGGSRQRLTYDGLHRLKSKELIDPADDNQAQAFYSYDNEHNILSIGRGFGTIQYGYDDLYRLTSSEHPELDNESFLYDGVHNRLQQTVSPADTSQAAATTSWQYNGDNQLLTYGSVETGNTSFEYDANGNLIKRSFCLSDVCESRYYSYDARERLVKLEQQQGTDEKVLLAEYGYNQLGQRIWKKVNNVTTYFLYDQSGLLAEYDAQGELVKEYSYTPGSTFMTNPLFMRSVISEGAQRIDYYFNDHLGTPQKLISRFGAIVWSAQSAAFGSVIINTEAVVNNLRFPGQYYDAESGSYYNYYRDYDPVLGRYLQSDPIGLSGGVNRYVYAISNSPNRYDYYGLDDFGIKIDLDLVILGLDILDFSSGIVIDTDNFMDSGILSTTDWDTWGASVDADIGLTLFYTPGDIEGESNGFNLDGGLLPIDIGYAESLSDGQSYYELTVSTPGIIPSASGGTSTTETLSINDAWIFIGDIVQGFASLENWLNRGCYR